jgi:hypothetical protein
MNYARNRQYTRNYKKKLSEFKEKTIDLSAAAAVGILAATFLKGMFWGYIIRKRLNR